MCRRIGKEAGVGRVVQLRKALLVGSVWKMGKDEGKSCVVANWQAGEQAGRWVGIK